MFLLLQMKAFPAGCPHVAVLTYLICSIMEPHPVLVTVATIDAYLRAVSMCSSSGWGGRPVLCTVRVPVLVSDAVRSDGGDGDGS